MAFLEELYRNDCGSHAELTLCVFVAVEYCRELRAENKKLQKETEKIKEEISKLTAEIRYAKYIILFRHKCKDISFIFILTRYKYGFLFLL